MENKIKSAQTIIRVAAIVRLVLIAASAVLLAYAYSDRHENMSRVYRETSCLGFVVPGFILDMVLTILWLYRPKLHTVHLVLYILLGGFFYLTYVLDALSLSGIGAIAALVYAPCIWLAGLIPFIVCGIGRNKLAKARKEQALEA